jgi:hypothetical protein
MYATRTFWNGKLGDYSTVHQWENLEFALAYKARMQSRGHVVSVWKEESPSELPGG